MATTANKVKFNIKNFHYAIKDAEGKYGTPVHIPGSVSIALSPKGEIAVFYADGIKYYTAAAGGGYEGDLELALISDQFRQEVLGEVLDANKVLFETNSAQTVDFAAGFDIDGDVKTTRFWFYNCNASRPSTESKTNEESNTPVTDKITITCSAGDDGLVRAKTTSDTTDNVFNSWYDSVYEKTAA